VTDELEEDGLPIRKRVDAEKLAELLRRVQEEEVDDV